MSGWVGERGGGGRREGESGHTYIHTLSLSFSVGSFSPESLELTSLERAPVICLLCSYIYGSFLSHY